MSDKTENVDTAFNTIKERIDKDRKEIVVTLDNKDAVDEVALIENDKKTFEEFGRIFKVSLNIDLKQRKIIITGLGDTVMECYQKILSELRDRKKMIMSKEIGSTLQKHVEWYFTEDKGDLWVPYPRYLSYILEEAFESNVNVKEFQDSNKKTYVVDFVKGNEVEKEDKHNATVVSVIRKDYTEGIGEVFPKCWTYMAEGENLAEVVLDSSDAEYKDAEAAFLKTIVPYNLSQIKEIRRVQNRKPVPAIPNKKEAAGNGPAKCAEYRTKSYAGNTFGGVWYGSGVYFAVKSMYSSNDSYSKPDPQGWKRMFLVKVLTGKTTNVAKGYTDRFPPLIPGSQTDRYNSTCDDMANPTEFVIYNDIQAYPEYVIVFK
ncbi:hypothetical protein DPMN_008574 [Dreissena polymorpha]|uniref:Poly [ADP-ribose] polymerase n=1 Tax=Dreissena polymorpha TaxID=45954 RepID=A0A9D4MZ10_DREPO|nr:hypothetical protein DPMN_008574 [Dreissena polymorpha]